MAHEAFNTVNICTKPFLLMAIENAIIVVDDTRLDKLVARFNTKAQTQFVIEQKGGDFNDYVEEHDQFNHSLDIVQKNVSRELKYKVLERRYISNFIFSEKDVVLVVGRDGLVANTAKYVNNIPILGINADPSRYDGVLLPFTFDSFQRALDRTLEGKEDSKLVTMAEASLNDGQRLLAFNDLFIGPSTHLSARYEIRHRDLTEQQSSSGIIVSTGAGSTGWLSSLFNMANGITEIFSRSEKKTKSFSKAPPSHPSKVEKRLSWEAQELVFVVREPFLSRSSTCKLAAGMINGSETLELESLMPSGGVIFSDGIEQDYLQFNSGTIAKIGIADEKAKLVVG